MSPEEEAAMQAYLAGGGAPGQVPPAAPTTGIPAPMPGGPRAPVLPSAPSTLGAGSITGPDPNGFTQTYTDPTGKKLNGPGQSAGGRSGFDQQGGGWFASKGISKGTKRTTLYNDGRQTEEVYDGSAWSEPAPLPTNEQQATAFKAATNQAAVQKEAATKSQATADATTEKAGDLYKAQGKLYGAQAAEKEAENAFRQGHQGHSPQELTQQWQAVQEYARVAVAKDANQLEWAKAYLAQEHQNFVNLMSVASAQTEKAKIASSERATDMNMATDIARQTGENARAMLPYTQTPQMAAYRAGLMNHMAHAGEANQPPMPDMPADWGAPVFDPRTLAHDAAMQVLRSKYGQGGNPGTAFTLPPSTDLNQIAIPKAAQVSVIANPGQVSSAFSTPPPGGQAPSGQMPSPTAPFDANNNPTAVARAQGVPGSGLVMTPNGPMPILAGPGYGQMPGWGGYNQGS